MTSAFDAAAPPAVDAETVALSPQFAAAPIDFDASGMPAAQNEPQHAAEGVTDLRAAYDAMIERGGTPLNPATTEDGEDVAEPEKKRKRRIWPWIVFPILAILIALGVVGYIFFQQAMQVKDDLTAAKNTLTSAVKAVSKGDAAGIQAAGDEVLVLTTRADETVSSPLWDIAAHVPFVGANIVAVQETTKATHILVRDAMPPALGLLATMNVDALKLEGGGFDLQPFRDAMPVLPEVTAAFQDAQTHVDKIDREAILPFVDENIGQLVDIVDEATPAIAMLEKYLPQLITLLGGDGPRDYAILFQNNAEIRATGGNPGTSSILHVDNGSIQMREDADVAYFAWLGHHNPGIEYAVDNEMLGVFESDTLGYVQNYTRFPDFSDTAKATQAVWQEATGGDLAGVISIDPVLLSYMLEVTGPVSVPGEDEKITADNAVKLLLSDTYERFGSDGRAADAYFAKAASAIFEKIAAGKWAPLDMFDRLARGVDEQRLYLWFPVESEQALSVEFGLDGKVTADNTTTVQTGIYLNDAAYSKLEYYLTTSVAVQCDDVNRTVTTSMTMTNNTPGDDLSDYTLGVRNQKYFGVPRTTMIFDMLALALPGGQLTAVDPTEGDASSWDREGVYNGRQIKSTLVQLPIGETRTVSFTSTVPADATTPLTVRYTPTTVGTPVTIAESCMTMFPGTVAPAAPAE